MVTTILLQYTSAEDTLVAALLHDIVDGVTKFDRNKKKIKLSEYENIQKLIEQEAPCFRKPVA